MKPSSVASSRDESGGEGDAPLIVTVVDLLPAEALSLLTTPLDTNYGQRMPQEQQLDLFTSYSPPAVLCSPWRLPTAVRVVRDRIVRSYPTASPTFSSPDLYGQRTKGFPRKSFLLVRT